MCTDTEQELLGFSKNNNTKNGRIFLMHYIMKDIFKLIACEYHTYCYILYIFFGFVLQFEDTSNKSSDMW